MDVLRKPCERVILLFRGSVVSNSLLPQGLQHTRLPCCCCCCCLVTSVVSDSVRPHRRQPTRLPHSWDSPGKNTGVGCHLLLQCMKVKSESEVAQSCPTLSDPMDCSPPGSSVHGIFQARVLENPDFPVLPYLLEFTQTHVHWVSDAIQPSHPLPPSAPFALSSLFDRWGQWGSEISSYLSTVAQLVRGRIRTQFTFIYFHSLHS